MTLYDTVILKSIGSFLEKLAGNSEFVYWLSSPDFSNIEYISPAFETIWGRSRKDLYADPRIWINFLHPEDSQSHHPIEDMRQRMHTHGQEARYEENYRIVRPDGEVRWIMDRGFPVLDANHECIAVTGVAVDVTKERQVEAALQQAKELAEASSAAKDEFIRNIQHDIRTPFSGIVGMADFLAQQEKEPHKKQALQDIVNCSKELMDYCDRIVEFSCIEQGKTEQASNYFDPRETMHKIEALESIAATHKNLELTIEVDDNVPAAIHGDNFQLQSILLNLIGNAIKFTKKGFVKVKLAAKSFTPQNQQCTLVFTIADSGPGIPKSFRKTMYDKFTRATPSYQGVNKGQGLGLSIVKRLVSDLNGSIKLLEPEDKTHAINQKKTCGSTFIVELPFTLHAAHRAKRATEHAD